MHVDGMLKLKHHIQSINPKILFATMPPEERTISTVNYSLNSFPWFSKNKNLQQCTCDTSYSTSSHSSAQRTLSPICNCPPAPTDLPGRKRRGDCAILIL